MMLEKDSYDEFIKYIHSVISFYERGNEHKYTDIKRDISVLENRMNDENLYLGVVGSFSSGKSTFINSVIHKNLLPTDAVQGTTVAASILKRAEYDDLEITYLDGTSKRYSQCADELLEKYQIQDLSTASDEIESVTIWKKIINWIKRLFRIDALKKKICPGGKERIALFKKIIATEDMARDIQYVTLYYQNDNIPYKIAMVDTPGTESLNERHNDVTKNAIDNICDAIVVIIPYDKPVSEELLKYVNTNLEKQKEECIFVVTKVELLGDKEELPRLIRVIKKRLENGLGIENAHVIPMPTLIYLKSVDSEMQTTFLDDVPESERAELLQMYEKGIGLINDILSAKRTEYINNKVINICACVGEKLSLNLSDVVNNYEEKNRQLKNEVVVPLHSFEQKAVADIENTGNLYQNRVKGEMGFINISLSAFRSEIQEAIESSNDSQELYNYLKFDLNTIFYDINLAVDKLLENAKEGLNSKLHDLQKNFKIEYERCGVRCKVRDIFIDTDDFYEERFINECESILQDCVNSVRDTIRSDTNGLFKKVKAFFSNPLSRHKELALTELSAVVDRLSQKITDYTVEHVKEKLIQTNMEAQRSIQNMLDGDRQVINGYINTTNRAIESNTKNKDSTKACINRLNEYIMLMKEKNYGEADTTN
ncbi:dynamin family protein [Roseburia faecis]|uniref:dynamin family protein n=1 Tax=Roseburia faecis TaxID=301302 RepID=UPI003F9B6E11